MWPFSKTSELLKQSTAASESLDRAVSELVRQIAVILDDNGKIDVIQVRVNQVESKVKDLDKSVDMISETQKVVFESIQKQVNSINNIVGMLGKTSIPKM